MRCVHPASGGRRSSPPWQRQARLCTTALQISWVKAADSCAAAHCEEPLNQPSLLQDMYALSVQQSIHLGHCIQLCGHETKISHII